MTSWTNEEIWDCLFLQIFYFLYWEIDGEITCCAVSNEFPKVGVLKNSYLPVLSKPSNSESSLLLIDVRKLAAKFLLLPGDKIIENHVGMNSIFIAKPLLKVG